MLELAYLPATEAISLFRSGDLAPIDLMHAVVQRAQATEPVVNAFCDLYFEDALNQARIAGERYARGEARPLEGLPVAIKEEQPIAGLPWREGSTLLRDNVATRTHPVVERIMAAGGIVHARTTTPEFCCAGFTHSDLWGVTRTPWNPMYSSGGSSGGSGASSPPGPRPWPPGRTSVGRSVSRRRSTGSSGSNRRTGACRGCHRRAWTRTATTVRWRGPCPTARCCRTSSRAATRWTRCRCRRPRPWRSVGSRG
ncbi:hypothetical protein GCM10029964_106350 [Kibdelosporangium lantanae]